MEGWRDIIASGHLEIQFCWAISWTVKDLCYGIDSRFFSCMWPSEMLTVKVTEGCATQKVSSTNLQFRGTVGTSVTFVCHCALKTDRNERHGRAPNHCQSVKVARKEPGCTPITGDRRAALYEWPPIAVGRRGLLSLRSPDILATLGFGEHRVAMLEPAEGHGSDLTPTRPSANGLRACTPAGRRLLARRRHSL